MNSRKTKNDWNTYIEDGQHKSVRLYKSHADLRRDKVSRSISYTHAFFEEHQLENHLNIPCKRALQLGAANGEYLLDLKEFNWDIVGYDYSPAAIKSLKEKNIIAREVDLNARDASGNLSYHADLIQDISKPVNIFLIRILQYLDLETLNLLLLTLIEHAAPGSMFFIAGNIDEDDPELKKPIDTYTRNYKASFFAPRTDMEFLVGTDTFANDELLVIRKR